MRSLALSVLLLSAASCGDDGGSSNPSQDASTATDASDVDAAVPTGVVKLTVLDAAGAGIAGVRVHFQNADSTLVLSANTDASGVATATMADGGYVSAIDPFVDDEPNLMEVRTFAGVKGGDDLVLRADPYTGAVTNVTVTGPADADSSVTNYRFKTPCTTSGISAPVSGNPQTTLGLYGPCLPTTDHLITSLDASQQVVKFAFAASQTIAGSTLDLSGSTLIAPTMRTYTLSNVPTGQSVNVDQRLYSSRGELWAQSVTTTGTTTVTGTQAVPAFAGSLSVVEARSSVPFSQHGVVDWGPFAATVAIDYGARLLKRVTTPPSLDVANQRLLYNESASGQVPEFVLGTVAHVRQAEERAVLWQLAAPYAVGGVRLPTLPVENSVDLNLPGSDFQVVQFLVFGAVSGGYDAVRGRLLSINGPQDIASGAAGQMTYLVASSSNNTRTLGTANGRLAPTSVAPGWMRQRRL